MQTRTQHEALAQSHRNAMIRERALRDPEAARHAIECMSGVAGAAAQQGRRRASAATPVPDPTATNRLFYAPLDSGVTLDGSGRVSGVASVTGPDLTQTDSTRRPDLVTTAPNGQYALRMGTGATASDDAVIKTAAAISATAQPYTIHQMIDVQNQAAISYPFEPGTWWTRMSTGRVYDHFGAAGTNPAITAGWHWIGISLKVGSTKLYVDGVLHATLTGYSNSTIGTNTGIGGSPGGTGTYDGDMTTPIVYSGNQNETAAEWNSVVAHLNAKYNQTYPDL